MSACIKQLKEKVQALYHCTTASSVAKAKEQFRSVLRSYCSQGDCEKILEEILVIIILDPHFVSLLPIVEREVQASEWFDVAVEQMARRLTECSGSQKIMEKKAEPVRHFLTRQIFRREHLKELLLEQARKSPHKCERLFELIIEFWQKNRQGGNLTSLLVVCLQAVKEHKKINQNILKKSLTILDLCFREHQQLRSEILDQLQHQLFQIFEGRRAPGESLSLLNMIVREDKREEKADRILKIVSNVYIEGGKDLSKDRKIIETADLGIGMDQFQNFFNHMAEFVQLFFSLNRENSYFQLLIQQLLLVKVPKASQIALEKFLELNFPNQQKDISIALLWQCLTNCSVYSLSQSHSRQSQQKALAYAYEWVNQNLTDPQLMDLICKVMRKPDTEAIMLFTPSHALTYFLECIRRSVEEQFEFEFDVGQVSSAANLFCYLGPYIVQAPTAKEDIFNGIKMFLNLNESCEAQFKPLLVHKIIHILCVYGENILPGNQFLQEVLEQKLMERFPSSFQNMDFLASQNMLTKNISKRLLEKTRASQSFMQEIQTKQAQKVCRVIVKIEKMDKIEWPSDRWLILSQKIGKELFEEWEVDRLALQGVKKRLKSQNLYENEKDIRVIENILK